MEMDEVMHEWWWDDIPEEWEPAEPPREPEEPEQLQWLGEFEWAEAVQPIHDPVQETWTQTDVDRLFPTQPSVDVLKFATEMEMVMSKLELSNDVKMQTSLYLPYLRPRMGDRKTTCAAVVLLVCRKAGQPLSLAELASATDLQPSKIFKRLQLVKELVD